jgi:pyruvate formate lyase activating enzyme
VPGFNDDGQNIDRTAAFVSTLPRVSRLNILPYHCAAAAKYKNLGLNFRTADIEQPSRQHLESVVRRLENYHLEVKIGG